MNNSPIEKEFIEWCQFLHPDFNAYIFLQRHNRYSEEYFPLFDEMMTELHQTISKKNPNVNFSFKGRVKSLRSFLIKTFRTIAENIEEIFPSEFPEDSEELANLLKRRDLAIEKFFKFLINENPKKYEKIKTLIQNLSPSFDTLEAFRAVFAQLTPDEKNKLATRLGRTEDGFAFRAIVHSVDFNISSISQNTDNSFEIIDDQNNVVPIRPAVTFDPEKDIIHDPNGSTYVIINGKKERLDERNLLYPRDISNSDRNINNALKDSNGKLTLLYDSIVVNDSNYFDIVSIDIDPVSEDILIYNQYGECKNISLFLSNSKKLKLQKTDEKYTIPVLYDIEQTIEDYYKENDIITIASRRKDYIANPKPDSNYSSLHDSAFNEEYGYTLEAQIRDLKMEDDCKNENSPTGHDKYKQNKLKRLLKNSILRHILSNNELAFDSSTSTLIKILDNPDVELPEILSNYLLITKVKDGQSASYHPTIDKSFEHTFENSTFELDKDDPAPPLDMSSYKNFIKSRKIRNEFKRKENKFPDFYE